MKRESRTSQLQLCSNICVSPLKLTLASRNFIYFCCDWLHSTDHHLYVRHLWSYSSPSPLVKWNRNWIFYHRCHPWRVLGQGRHAEIYSSWFDWSNWPTVCVSSCFLFTSCLKMSQALGGWAGRSRSAPPSSGYSRESSKICQYIQGCYEYRFYQRIFGSISRCLFISVALTYVSSIPLTMCVSTWISNTKGLSAGATKSGLFDLVPIPSISRWRRAWSQIHEARVKSQNLVSKVAWSGAWSPQSPRHHTSH